MTAFAPAKSIDKRIVISALVLVVIAAIFWLGSRYPSLNEKALMGVDSPISGLAFDTLVTILPDTSETWKAAMHFVNWMYTNWRGMTFGILFGAGLLTLLSLIQTVSFKSRFANAALGMIIGAPMGVCANCAAPIAKGLHNAGTRFETTIGALMASPTLNVIVVSISFALLPTYMAVAKVAMMVLFILLIVPLLGRLAERLSPDLHEKVVIRTQTKATIWSKISSWWQFNGLGVAAVSDAENRSLPAAIWFVKSFLRSLWFLCITTIPMMLIAGLIGAILITFFPLENAVRFLDNSFQGSTMVLLGMALLAILAVLLPVPIAFDVIIVAILLVAGLDAKYAMILLLGLGPYSMVAFLIVGQSTSYRVASLVGTAVVALAFTAGFVGHYGHKRAVAMHQEMIIAQIGNVPSPNIKISERVPAMPLAEIQQKSAAISVPMNPLPASIEHSGAGQVSAFTRPQQTPTPAATGTVPFKRVVGAELGLSEEKEMSALYGNGFAGEVQGIASGDVNNDGWVDVAFAADTNRGGVSLYVNLGGTYARQDLDLGPMNTAMIGSLALVDINNDGALDLFVPSVAQGNYVFFNDNGTYGMNQHVKLPDVGSFHTIAPGFADFDNDGKLDILLGNSTGGNLLGEAGHMTFTRENARDYILWNEGDDFTPMPLSGVPGHTLTSLIWDVNTDGRLDILIGDDFAPTDKIYLNTGPRTFELATRESGLVPRLLSTTMSYDFGDMNNDLTTELYGVEISKGDFVNSEGYLDVCNQIFEDGRFSAAERDDCFQVFNYASGAMSLIRPDSAFECSQFDAANNNGVCKVASYISEVFRNPESGSCDAIRDDWIYYRQFCDSADSPRASRQDFITFIKSSFGVIKNTGNLLFSQSEDGTYTDIAAHAGVSFPGWGWNAKFADLDQDGLQDIYVAIGRFSQNRYRTNAFYHNEGNNQFTAKEDGFGLYDSMPSSSHVLVDFDRDGDVDIIRGPTLTHVVVHQNDAPAGNALWVDLNDELGNHFGVGATILAHADGVTRRRDIKASGGFSSADAPMVHFGVGGASEIDWLEVQWPNATKTRVTGPFKANSHITVVRKK